MGNHCIAYFRAIIKESQEWGGVYFAYLIRAYVEDDERKGIYHIHAET
jgi:hypothetical protein